jgi:hypothetical protein
MDCQALEATLAELPRMFSCRLHPLSKDIIAIDTPFFVGDGDTLGVFVDLRYHRLTDLGETIHRLADSGVPIDRPNWSGYLKATTAGTVVECIDGELVVPGPLSAHGLVALIQTMLRLSERASVVPVRRPRIFRDTVKDYLTHTLKLPTRAQYRVAVADTQITFDFYVATPPTFIKTLSTPPKFAQNAALTFSGMWTLVRTEMPTIQRVTVVRPSLELPKVLLTRLEETSTVVPWENRAQLRQFLSA